MLNSNMIICFKVPGYEQVFHAINYILAQGGDQ
jgi:hypothetical protein